MERNRAAAAAPYENRLPHGPLVHFASAVRGEARVALPKVELPK